MDCRTTYPTMAAVMEAHTSTLSTWHKNLPPPKTDVERAVSNRISRRLRDEVLKEAPEIADVFSAIARIMKAHGIQVPNDVKKWGRPKD